MSPAVKYTLGRLGLFVLILVLLLLLFPLNIFVSGMIALLGSAVLSYFVLADWRNQMGEQLAGVAARRAAEKERLRAALAGDEDAAAVGDRAAVPADTVPAHTVPADLASADRVPADRVPADPAPAESAPAEPAANEKN